MSERIEAPKPITFTYEGKNYTLTYTRKSVQQTEALGFSVQSLTDKPVTMIPLLFAGAFYANHKGITADKVDEIYKHLTNKDKLIGRLIEMYQYTFAVMTGEYDEDDAKNIDWA